METILTKLLEQNTKIERDISRIGSLEVGEICSNIISKLRTFVEHIAAYHYVEKNSLPNVVLQENIKNGIKFVNKDKSLNFIKELHQFLQASASHYVISEVTSPRLIQKYLPYLFHIKEWMKKEYNIILIKNLYELSKLNDSNLVDYYGQINKIINNFAYLHKPASKDRYYVYSCYPSITNNKLIYEVTLGIASDYASKFNRFIAFSNENIPTNYSIKCDISTEEIEVISYATNVRIIQDWCISIRPCEMENLGKILGINDKIMSNSSEYMKLMAYLTDKRTNLLEIIKMEKENYDKLKTSILTNINEGHIFKILDSARCLADTNYSETNLIMYLAYNLNNKVIKDQSSITKNNIGLYVNRGVIPFCKFPFAMSLKKHNTSLIDLIKIFGNPPEDQLVYRKIINKSKKENNIYYYLNELFEDNLDGVKKNIESINKKLDWRPELKIENIGELYYIKKYENTSKLIIDKLLELSGHGIEGYCNFINEKIVEYNIEFDSKEKEDALLHLFEETRALCIYGSAGTGKSFLAKLISKVYKDSKKIYLANTNAAVDNLYQKVGGDISNFMTITKYLQTSINCDILFIDECSMVSNDDMLRILNKNMFGCLVLMGDIVQIESIEFGNWYKFAKAFLKGTAKIELKEMHRTSSQTLKLLWEKVREKEKPIDEILLQYDMVKELDDPSLFIHDMDEIVLALNYNGIYGINNLNNIMQEKNNNLVYRIGIATYKVGDPIIFTDNNKYAPILYNNLKGEILTLKNNKDKITFTICIDTVINEKDLNGFDEIKLLEVTNEKSVISIDVEKVFNSDEDEKKSTLVPFQIAYAVSIHKSQGLEFKSVKIVIGNDVDDEINHNIFYTAITRSTYDLKIYWGKDTQRKVLDKISEKNKNRDIGIFASKMKYKIRQHI